MRIALMLIVGILLTACANQPPASAFETPGFWYGLLHGVIAPFALIVSFFKSDVRIYEFPNSGWWYDFGYIIGTAIVFGTLGREGEKYYAAGYAEGFEAGKTGGENSR